METSTSTQPRKAYVESYGCQMNVADGELMQGVLASAGYALAATPEEADVILVNTCAIRDHAEQRVLGRVGELSRIKQERPDVVIGVTGCMAQRMGTQLLERAQYVELVMGPDNYRKLPQILNGLRAPEAKPITKRRALPVVSAVLDPRSSIPDPRSAIRDPDFHDPGRIASLDFHQHENYEGIEIRRTSKLTAWVAVQRGCNYRCTYCIVPYVRGDEKNRDPQHILAEVRSIAEQGIREVTLLGQTVNSYEHGDWTFPRLLRGVASIDGIKRVRFTSPHPNDFNEALVQVMAEEPAVCKQLHLPVQSGHNRTLKRMLRRYTVESYLEKIALVRRAIPDIALSTDIIVAFPGETHEEFEATLDLMRAVGYDDAFMYKYSLREGTPATRLPAHEFIPEAEAQQRLQTLIDLHRVIQRARGEAELGRVVEVMIERAARSSGDILGRTEGNKVVAFNGDVARAGEFTWVQLTGTSGATFSGIELARVT